MNCLLLRKLEAYGFKSFADKTELEFGPGITVVVGPNGSGKSNISDAIRWALGEQSVRNLRGVKTEDVIFAGSTGRRPLGVAEVSLVFDNSDGGLPLDFNEVTITRRVFRSGDGEYFINKARCRLKDIYELLADTGLGRDAMPVIGQNKIDEVLNSKAEERRLLFEEAAGITKFKQRKKEALRKLEDTAQNLTRVSDITTEIESQLEPLAESAARTARYNDLCRELTSYQVTLLMDKLSKAEKMVESANLQQQTLTDDEIAVNTQLTLHETELERLNVQLTELNEKITLSEAGGNKANTDLERTNGKIAVLEERIKQEQGTDGRIAGQICQAKAQQADINNKISSLQNQLTDKLLQESSVRQDLEVKIVEYQRTLAAIRQIEQQIEKDKDQNFEQLQKLVSERNKFSTAERDLARLKMRQLNFDKEYQDYCRQLSQAELQYDSILTERQALQATLLELESKNKALAERNKELEQSLSNLAVQEKKLTGQLTELTSKLNVLSGMQQELEGFGRGIKSILNCNKEWREGICGAVAQILKVPDRYVTAVEVALGGALQHIITQNDQIAKYAIQFLKSQNLGRATFLPLNTIKVTRPRDFENAASAAQGALGFASQLVNCQEHYRNVVNFLLGRTIVAENIDIALRIAKQNSFSIKLVTLEGEIVNPGGSMTGGSTNRREASFLSRNNEIAAIKRSIAEIKDQLSSHKEMDNAVKADLATMRQDSQLIYQERQAAQVRQAELAIHAEKQQVEIKRLALATRTLNEEMARAQQEQELLENNLRDLKANIAIMEDKDSDHKQQIAELQQKAKELQANKDLLNDAVTETKIVITALSQEIAAVRSNSERYKQDGQQIQAYLENLLAEQSAAAVQVALAKQELQELITVRTTLTKEKIRYEKEYQIAYSAKMAVLTSIQKLEKELKELRRKHNDILARLHEAELIAAKYGYEVTACREQLQEQFSLSKEQAKEICLPESHEEAAAVIKKLETEIALLGPVNPIAVEEYARVQERYQFLQQQYRDLMEARDYLASIINDIDKNMSRQFADAFKKINEYFGDIFGRLFGGGKAQLQLMEPDNVLETGIDIIVQPPGKKQQNLILLSGGERALTVIALLFAFLTYRPVPFTMVDEIDAALDEANIQRFSEFLRDYARNTQFIVVTHRKATMEVADVLHGITMEEAGVSRLVSIKFMDKAG